MTALTLVVTLSLVMTSCGGTSRVITRRSIFTSRSTPNGMMKRSPAGFRSIRRPRRNTTPRSYSLMIRRLEKTTTRASRTMTPTTMSVPMSTALLLLVLLRGRFNGSGFARFDFEPEPIAAHDLDGRAGGNGRARGRRLPQDAAHRDQALWRQRFPCFAGGADQCF